MSTPGKNAGSQANHPLAQERRRGDKGGPPALGAEDPSPISPKVLRLSCQHEVVQCSSGQMAHKDTGPAGPRGPVREGPE